MKVKTRQTATISLILMSIGFIITLFFDNKTTLLVLQSGFEAGLVGGLADWFAVTALFRHPLGIPIPHTAILPNNRERITQALVSTVENDLLNKSSIIDKIKQLDMTRKFLKMCESYLESNPVKYAIANIAKSIVNSIPTANISDSVQRLLGSYIDGVESKKLLELLAEECFKREYDHAAFDILVDKLEDTLKKPEIQKNIGATALSAIGKLHVSGVMQYTLNTIANIAGEERISGILQDLITTALHDLKNPSHPNRQLVLNLLRVNIKDICNDEALIEKLESFKQKLKDSSELNRYIHTTLDDIKNKLLQNINSDSYMDSTVLPYIKSAIIRISMNDDIIAKLDIYIQEQISDLIDHNHKKIGKLVEENIEKFDNDTLIRLIEDKVGDDLQWIRVNGAVCGFVIGIALGLIKLLGFVGM